MFEGSKFCSINRAKPRPTDNHDTMCAGWQGTQLSVNSNSHEVSQSPFSLSGLSLTFPFRVSISLSLSGRAAGEVPFFPPPMYIPRSVAYYFSAILMFFARSTRDYPPSTPFFGNKGYAERFQTSLSSGCDSIWSPKWTSHTNIAVLSFQNKKFLGSLGPRKYISSKIITNLEVFDDIEFSISSKTSRFVMIFDDM